MFPNKRLANVVANLNSAVSATLRNCWWFSAISQDADTKLIELCLIQILIASRNEIGTFLAYAGTTKVSAVERYKWDDTRATLTRAAVQATLLTLTKRGLKDRLEPLMAIANQKLLSDFSAILGLLGDVAEERGA